MHACHSAALTLALAAAAHAGVSDLTAPAAPSKTGESLPAGAGAGEWRFSLSPYLWVPGQHGHVTARGRTAPEDIDVSDMANLLDEHFNGALVLHGEVSRGLVSVFGDAMYIDLDSSRNTAAGTGSVRYSQGVYELGAAYAVVGLPPTAREPSGLSLEPLAGARVYTLNATLLGPGGRADAEGDEMWIDGFAGVRASCAISSTFSLFGRADIGAGGSDLAWNALGGVQAHFTRWLSLEGGWRWLDIEYSTGSGADEFAYDVQLSGPFMALTFKF